MKIPLIFFMLGMILTPSWAQEEAPLETFESPDKEWSIRLPSGWRVKPAVEEQAMMAFDATVTGAQGTGYGRITLFRIRGMQMAASQPYADRPAQLKRYDGEQAEIGLQPLPHLAFRYSQKGRAFAALMIYRVLKGRGVAMVCIFDERVMEAIRLMLFEAAASLSTQLDPWPASPEGYAMKIRGDYRYFIHPDFQGNPSTVHTFLIKEAKDFQKIHRPFEIDPESPPTVILFNTEAEVSRMVSDGTFSGGGAYCDFPRKRLFLGELPRKKTMERANLVREVALYLYSLRYGNLMPHWVCAGEGELALERTLLGKDLPYISEGRHANLPKNPEPLTRVIRDLEEENRSSFIQHAFVYAALFRMGDRKIRGAFEQFLEAYHRTGDWDAATEMHLLALDQEALKAEALELVGKRLKPVKLK